MGDFQTILLYFVSLALGLITILIGTWLSKALLFLFSLVYEAGIKRVFPQSDKAAEKAGFLSQRMATGLTIGLLQTLSVFYLGLKMYILLAVFIVYLAKFSEPFDYSLYSDLCDGNLKNYKVFSSKLKILHLVSYLVTYAPGILISF